MLQFTVQNKCTFGEMIRDVTRSLFRCYLCKQLQLLLLILASVVKKVVAVWSKCMHLSIQIIWQKLHFSPYQAWNILNKSASCCFWFVRRLLRPLLLVCTNKTTFGTCILSTFYLWNFMLIVHRDTEQSTRPTLLVLDFPCYNLLCGHTKTFMMFGLAH